MEYPTKITDIAKDSCTKYPDVQEAIAKTINRVKRLKDYKSFMNVLVYNALTDLVYDTRHRSNVAIKRQAGEYGTGNKTDYVGTRSVQQATKNYLNYYIAGRTLGNILGSEIEDLIDIEVSLSDGHDYNTRILEALKKIVPEDKRVKDVVSNKQLEAIFIKKK